MHVVAVKSLAHSVFEVEAKALVIAMKVVTDLNVGKVIFEGDAVNAILALNGVDPCVEWSGRPDIIRGKTFLNTNLF